MSTSSLTNRRIAFGAIIASGLAITLIFFFMHSWGWAIITPLLAFMFAATFIGVPLRTHETDFGALQRWRGSEMDERRVQIALRAGFAAHRLTIAGLTASLVWSMLVNVTLSWWFGVLYIVYLGHYLGAQLFYSRRM